MLSTGMGSLLYLEPLNLLCSEGVSYMLKNMMCALNSQSLYIYIYIEMCVCVCCSQACAFCASEQIFCACTDESEGSVCEKGTFTDEDLLCFAHSPHPLLDCSHVMLL